MNTICVACPRLRAGMLWAQGNRPRATHKKEKTKRCQNKEKVSGTYLDLCSTILDTIRDSLKLHVGFCRWSDGVGNLFWVCSARDNDGRRWVAKHEDFDLATVVLAELVAFDLRDG